MPNPVKRVAPLHDATAVRINHIAVRVVPDCARRDPGRRRAGPGPDGGAAEEQRGSQ